MTGAVRDPPVRGPRGHGHRDQHPHRHRVKTETDGAVSTRFPSLRPGDYSVTAETPGFPKIVRTGVTPAGRAGRAHRRTLQTGAVTETVEVVGATSLLAPNDLLARAWVIDQKKIVELPLNGRDYNQLALLSPGVLPGTPRLASVNFKGVLNVNGNRTFNNVFLLDGVDNISYSNSFRGENVQLVQPSIEALQEFKIQTNAYSAEYGRSSGAVVNATIKSGTNSVRGSVYEFLRNDALDAIELLLERARRAEAQARAQPVRRRGRRPARQEPHVLVRRLRRAARPGRHPARPPGADGGGKGRACSARAVVDPFAPGRPAFSQNAQGQWVIPRDRWDPVGAAIVALIPDANASAGGQPIYASTPVTDTRQDQFDVRIDHQFTPNVHDLRPLQLRGHADVPPGAAARAGRGIVQRRVRMRTTIDRRGSRSARPGRSRRRSSATSASARRAATTTRIRRISASTAPRRSACRTCPTIRRSSAACRRSTSRGSTPSAGTRRRRSSRRRGRWNPRATFSLSRGRALHQVRRRVPQRVDEDQRPERDDRADELREPLHQSRRRRSAARAAVAAGPDQLHGHGPGTEHAVLLRPGRLPRLAERLTANLGLRYEFATPPLEKDNQFANFDPATGTMVFAKDGSIVRARADPSRSQQLRAAHRLRLRAAANDWSCAAATASSTPTPCGRGAKGCSGSTRRTSSTTCCRRASRVRPRSRRRRRSGSVDGYPSGLARSGRARADRGAARAGSQSADRRTSSSTTSACSTS